MAGGGGGIRTHGTLSRTTVFKTVAIDHSATPPSGDGIGKVARFEKPQLSGKRGFSAIQRGAVRLCPLVPLSFAPAGRDERVLEMSSERRAHQTEARPLENGSGLFCAMPVTSAALGALRPARATKLPGVRKPIRHALLAVEGPTLRLPIRTVTNPMMLAVPLSFNGHTR